MYNITGWSGGGRRPLSYNLMPGQFRNTRVNVFSQPTIINNNMGGFGGYYDCGCDCGSSSKMGWMEWMMVGGMGLNFLGNLFSCFWGGGGGGADKTETPAADKFADLKNDVKAVSNGKAKVLSDGTIFYNGQKYDSLNELIDALNPSTQQGQQGQQIDPQIQKILDEYGIEFSDGKYKVNGQEFDTLRDAIKILNDNQSPTGQQEEEVAPFSNVLFKSGTSGLTSAAEEETRFEKLTGQAPFKITNNSGTITLSGLVDKGKPGDVNCNISIDTSKLTNSYTKIGDINGKEALAQKLGDYIRVKVGKQTYIVGMDNKAYQYENGNVDGFNTANWTSGGGR